MIGNSTEQDMMEKSGRKLKLHVVDKPIEASIENLSLGEDEENLLLGCNIKTKKLTFEGRSLRAKCVKVYDGDTATFVFRPFPQLDFFRFNCRFLGYNSAEIKTKDAEEKAKAVAARDYLASLILDKVVRLDFGKEDKYGRPLVDVYLGEFHVNSSMITNGHGKPYTGKGPKEF